MHVLEKKLQFSTEIAVCLRNNTRRRQVSGVATLRPISARYARVEFDNQRSNSAACNRDVLLMGQARPMPRTTTPAFPNIADQTYGDEDLPREIKVDKTRPFEQQRPSIQSRGRLSVCPSVCLCSLLYHTTN